MNNVLFPVLVFFNESIDFSTVGLLLDLLNEVICLKKNHKQINKTNMGYLRSTYVAPFFTKHIFPKHYLIYTFLLAISSGELAGGMVHLAKIYL